MAATGPRGGPRTERTRTRATRWSVLELRVRQLVTRPSAYLDARIRFWVKGRILYFSQFPCPAQTGAGFLRRKDSTDFRTEASGPRQDKYDVPNPPSSAVRWAVIRMGIFIRPWKAHAKGVVTLRRDIRTDLQNQYSVTSLAYHLKKKKKKKPEGIVSQ